MSTRVPRSFSRSSQNGISMRTARPSSGSNARTFSDSGRVVPGGRFVLERTKCPRSSSSMSGFSCLKRWRTRSKSSETLADEVVVTLMCVFAHHSAAPATAIRHSTPNTKMPTTTQTHVLTLPAITSLSFDESLRLFDAQRIGTRFAGGNRPCRFGPRGGAVPFLQREAPELEVRAPLHPDQRIGAERYLEVAPRIRRPPEQHARRAALVMPQPGLAGDLSPRIAREHVDPFRQQRVRFGAASGANGRRTG